MKTVINGKEFPIVNINSMSMLSVLPLFCANDFIGNPSMIDSESEIIEYHPDNRNMVDQVAFVIETYGRLVSHIPGYNKVELLVGPHDDMTIGFIPTKPVTNNIIAINDIIEANKVSENTLFYHNVNLAFCPAITPIGFFIYNYTPACKTLIHPDNIEQLAIISKLALSMSLERPNPLEIDIETAINTLENEIMQIQENAYNLIIGFLRDVNDTTYSLHDIGLAIVPFSGDIESLSLHTYEEG